MTRSLCCPCRPSRPASCVLQGRDRRQFFEDAAHLGLGNAQDASDLADGFLFGLDVGHVLALNLSSFVGAVAEVVVLVSEVNEFEVYPAIVVGDRVEQDVTGAVLVLAGTDFQLLHVADVLVLGGLADGHHVVEVVIQFLGNSSFCVMGLERERLSVCAIISRDHPYLRLRARRFIMNCPASTPLSVKLQR